MLAGGIAMLAGLRTIVHMRVSMRVHMRVSLGALVLLTTSAAQAHAQALLPKRTLAVGVAPGCVSVSGSRAGSLRRDNAEARRLAAAGQEAALVGDRTAAREAFARAAALNPGDERIAYDLGRAHEELADTIAAVSEYCRYLALSPDGREAADVRARLPRLIPRSAAQNAERVHARFRAGLDEYDARQYGAAADAFDEVVRRAPNAVEGYFNRGLARAAAGQREDALRDLEAYLVASPAAEDRAGVLRAIGALRRPVYSPGTALTRGFLPGFGQFYTGRPGRGVLVLAAVAGAVGTALHERTTVRMVPYIDPNGVSVPYPETVTERPFLQPAAAAAIVLTLGAAWEASRFASRSRLGVARVGSAGISPFVGTRGQVGLGVDARF